MARKRVPYVLQIDRKKLTEQN